MTLPVKATVFVGISLDGFLARTNHELDFLPPGGGEEHGYAAFIETVDTIVIGRKTYEKSSPFPNGRMARSPWSSSAPGLWTRRGAPGAVVERLAGSPPEVVARLAALGSKHLYVDGGITIQRFLVAGLIQRLIITRVPVLIGSGIPLFGALPHDIALQHVATRQYSSGLVQSEYIVPA